MPKIVFMGAGCFFFARDIIGDSMLRDSLKDSQFALYDIDGDRLKQAETILNAMNAKLNANRATITSYLGVSNRKVALRRADFVVNAINVGGYKPSTLIDFEVPKKFGLRQTIGDTLGIGGIFRALRTIPVVLDFARDIEEVAPNAWFLNYSNPMAMVTGALLQGSGVKTVGLCHSVQVVVETLFKTLGLEWNDERATKIKSKIAGINHMAWLLEISENGKDLYPELKKLADKKIKEWLQETDPAKKSKNMIRIEMMRRFGYYVTESSEHNAEYQPYWIKQQYPELINAWNIPLDTYLRRCCKKINELPSIYQDLLNKASEHKLSIEYGSRIIEAIVTNNPCQIGGNVMNKGLITNLPYNAVVEVPCLVDQNGIQGTYVGMLPPQCAALNMTNINVQLLTIEAALTQKKEHIYHAALLDPHTSSELSIDDTIKLCNAMIKAHGNMLPKYR